MAFIRRKFENVTTVKSYKTIINAKKEIDRIVDSLKDVTASHRIDYMFYINDDNRIRIVFLVPSQCEISFHYFMGQGHCVNVQN